MATFYLDFEAGSDAADGTTFANRWKTIKDGATAARIAPGDIIRIMGSPAPTSLGMTGAWTGGKRHNATGAAKNIESSTNATPIVVTITGHGYSNGDRVQVKSHTTNTNANGEWTVAKVAANTFELTGSVGNGVGGASGTVLQINECIVKLASALTQFLGGHGKAWTASANVTATINTTNFKVQTGAIQLAVAAGFTTGLAAYYATGPLDLSGYRQVTFWLRQTAGTAIVAGDISLRLCSDTVGAVSVQTIAIPGIGSVATSQWMGITVDIAGALPAAVNSIALYVDTDKGAQTFVLDNIQAAKDSTSADSLSLTSLIGKNTAGETWYPIQYIDGTVVRLGGLNSAEADDNTARGYAGTSETVTTHKRETIKMLPVSSGSVTPELQVQDSGSAGSLITFSGGWNRTDMSTQTLETWLSGQNGGGLGISVQPNASVFVAFTKIGMVWFNTGFQATSTSNAGLEFTECSAAGCVTGFSFSGNTSNKTATMTTCFAVTCTTGYTCNGGLMILTDVQAHSCSGVGISAGSSNGTLIGSNLTAINCATIGIQLFFVYHVSNATAKYCNPGVSGGRGGEVLTCTLEGNELGLQPSSLVVIYNLTSTGTGTGISPTLGVALKLFNALISDTTEVAAFAAGSDGRIISVKHDQTVDNHIIWVNGGQIISQTAVRHTASGIAWQISPSSTDRDATWPIVLPLGRVAVSASALVTVSVWLRRTNTGLTGTLRVRGGQIGGVAADVTDSIGVAADTWEQQTVTFTPNEAGVVEIEVIAYGGTTYNLYVDDLAVSQA